ncbi:MAG: hypothetical protein IPI02_01185 [Sterolibacteriaceae bacterium]|nr:hypothetical protein [Sterolibacteriaceae bacterium]
MESTPPSPLVLEFVEGVLGIRPIPVELTQTDNLVVGVGHQHRVLIARDALACLAVGFHEGQQLLTVSLTGHRDLARQRPAQHDDATILLPALEGKRPILALPTPGRHPSSPMGGTH